jgi:hypothetical protein
MEHHHGSIGGYRSRVGGSRPAVGIDSKVAGDNVMLLAALD